MFAQNIDCGYTLEPPQLKIALRLWGSFLWTRCADEESINTLENILHNLHAQSYHKTGDLTIVRLLTIPWDRYFRKENMSFVLIKTK